MTRTARKPALSADPLAGYQRVDVGLGRRQEPNRITRLSRSEVSGSGVRWAIIPFSALMCIVQAVASIMAENMRDMLLTCTLISVLAFMLIFALVLAVNPILRVAQAGLGHWARPLNRAELVCLFTAMLVTAGISSYGLADPLIPMLAAPNNPEWNTPARGWDEALVPSLNPKLYIQDREAIRMFSDGVILTDSQGNRVDAPRDAAPWQKKLAYGWKVFKVIPWMVWITPLSYWLIFIAACYGIFYCLTYIVLSYWSDREKLIFPLVRIYEAVLPDEGRGRYRIPPVLRSPGFWCGFALSFTVWAWNVSVSDGWLKNKGLSGIPLGMGLLSMGSVLNGSIFQGLAPMSGDSLMMLIIFTAVGIAFLLPLEISFSVWFYYVVGRVIMLLHIWSGRGESMLAFPTDNMWLSNPVTALGGGGLLVFSALCLFRCIRDYFRMIAGKSLSQRILIGLPVVGLVACIVVVVAWLHWNRLPVGWAIVFVACFTLLTIGLMRIVAESGMYYFEANTGFFHLYKMLGLGKILAPALLAPLAPIYAILFLDFKTFLAPNLLNAAEMRKNSRVSRWKFHLNLVICMAVSVVVSLAASIYLAHLRGADNMGMWYYTLIPPAVLDGAQQAISTLPAFDLTHTLWFVMGALWVMLSVFLRTTFFWFPHPIGFIMLVSPTMTALWFSFFLGWVCKRVVVRYGGKATFDRVRCYFIGLIAGELASVLFWAIVALATGMSTSGVTLNRWLA